MTAAALVVVLWASAAAQEVSRDLLRGRVLDAVTGAPVVSARVLAPRDTAVSGDDGTFRVRAVRGDSLRVQRIGYREARTLAGADGQNIALTPSAHRLARVEASGLDASVARHLASRDVTAERAAGAIVLSDVVRRLPFVGVRGARGEIVVSVRASRPEQVLVLLDGMPLNDPATGAADLGDIPLAVAGVVTAAPGGDAARRGSGASGGVLSLTSPSGPLLAAFAGAYGARGVEGAAHHRLADWSLRAGAHVSRTAMNYPFLNTERTPDSTEHRVNADERRASLFASAIGPRAHAAALLSERERGLAGAVNDRSSDTVRERMRRLLLQTASSGEAWRAAAGVRALQVVVRDPRRSTYRSDARSLSADADLARDVHGVTLQAGAGADHASGSLLDAPVRPRGHLSLSHERTRRSFRFAGAVRADAVRNAGVHLSPSVALERVGAVTLFARLAQGFRVPSFYDLYFASESGVALAAVAPERVRFDGETGARVARGAWQASAAVFARDTRDAIVWFPGFGLWSPQNVARERARGSEVRLALEVAAVAVDAWGAAYETRARVDGIDIPTPYVPHAAGGATARLRAGKLTLTTALEALGRRQFVLGPAAKRSELPGVALVDAGASYRFTLFRAGALVSAGVRNVAGVRWESVRRYPTARRSWSAALVLHPPSSRD